MSKIISNRELAIEESIARNETLRDEMNNAWNRTISSQKQFNRAVRELKAKGFLEAIV